MRDNNLVYFTGDIKHCPVCGKQIIGNDVSTHHTHTTKEVSESLCLYKKK